MKYVVASFGAAFIFVATLVLSAFLLPLLPEFLHCWITIGPIRINANIVVALTLAGAAAAVSFKGTVDHYARRSRKEPKTAPHD